MKKQAIPNTIYKAVIDGHEVTAIYHSAVWTGGWEGEPFKVESEDEGTKQKVLDAWKHEWRIDQAEIQAGRRAPYSTSEGVLLGMLEKMAGGEEYVEVVREPDMGAYGVRF